MRLMHLSGLFHGLSGCGCLAIVIATTLTPLNAQAGSDRPAEHANQQAQLFVGHEPMATTYGRGTASAPAQEATVSLYFNSMSTGSDGMSEIPAYPQFRDSANEFKAILLSLGINESQIETSITSYSFNLDITLKNPTQGDIKKLEEAASNFSNEDGQIYLSSSSSTCKVDDISTLEMEARQAAITEARSRIDAMAESLGGRAGRVLNAIEVYGYAPYSSACSFENPEDLTSLPTVEIEQGVILSFELL